MNHRLDRRAFLAAGAALAGGLLLPAAAATAAPLRIGLIGAGARGQALLQELLRRADVELLALCDTDPLMLQHALDQTARAGHPRPRVYGEDRDPQAYRRMLDDCGLDGVIIAAPLAWRAPMAIAALRAGVAVGVGEAGVGLTLQDHWDVLHAQLRSGTPYMPLDAAIFRREVVAVRRMVRAGVFGQLSQLQGRPQDIGACALYAGIHRGNRFTRIASDGAGTTLDCANGETIVLRHGAALPGSGLRVQGTQALWMDAHQSIHVDGASQPHRWDDFKVWQEQYDHPLWQRHANQADHGGMDWFAIRAFVEALKARSPMPLDIYDAVAWSAITPLAGLSIAYGVQTLDFPDFTGGQWRTRQPGFAPDQHS